MLTVFQTAIVDPINCIVTLACWCLENILWVIQWSWRNSPGGLRKTVENEEKRRKAFFRDHYITKCFSGHAVVE